jgi:hypothetical protein
MKMRTLLLRLAFAALAGVALAGCGNDPERASFAAFDLVRDSIGGRPAGPDARETVTAEQVDAAGTPVLLAVAREADLGSTLVPVAANLGTVQWVDIAGGGLLTREGVLVGTRGLGPDLLNADISGLLAALRVGGGQAVPRLELRLRPDNVVERTRYSCDIVRVGRERLTYLGRSFDTDRFEERCRNGADSVVNRYWIDDSGQLRQQEVLVSPQFGIMDLSLLRG